MQAIEHKVIIIFFVFICICVPQISHLSAREVKYTAEGLRDPFQRGLKQEGVAYLKQEPQTLEARPLPALVVQGIIWGGRFSQAIINNKVVREGDIIGGVKIIEIRREAITVLHENNQYKLSSPAATNLQKKSEGGKYGP